MNPTTTFQPRRGDAVERWLTARRGDAVELVGRQAPLLAVFDALLLEYAAHADAGTPLDQSLPPS